MTLHLPPHTAPRCPQAPRFLLPFPPVSSHTVEPLSLMGCEQLKHRGEAGLSCPVTGIGVCGRVSSCSGYRGTVTCACTGPHKSMYHCTAAPRTCIDTLVTATNERPILLHYYCTTTALNYCTKLFHQTVHALSAQLCKTRRNIGVLRGKHHSNKTAFSIAFFAAFSAFFRIFPHFCQSRRPHFPPPPPAIGSNNPHSQSMLNLVLVPQSGNLYQILLWHLRIGAQFSLHPIGSLPNLQSPGPAGGMGSPESGGQLGTQPLPLPLFVQYVATMCRAALLCAGDRTPPE